MQDRLRAVAMIVVLLGLWAWGSAKAYGLAPRAGEALPRVKDDQALREKVKSLYEKLPLSFEPNEGQTDPEVRFFSRGKDHNLFLTPSEAVLVLYRNVPPAQRKGAAPHGQGPHARQITGRPEVSSILRLKLLEANPDPTLAGLEERPDRNAYFIGKDRSKWRADIPLFGKVEYRKVYPGVDLVFYSNGKGSDGHLEYDFVVAPGADPNQIKLGFEGADKVEINEEGQLVLHTADGGTILQKAPAVYQNVEGERRAIEGRYVLLPPATGGNPEENLPRVGFQVAAYDREKVLVIDPVLSYSSYLGGTDYDFGSAIAVDAAGNAYVTGWTYSADFPVHKPKQGANAGSYDAFVTKINRVGTIMLYSTYIGGELGDDYAMGIAVDSSGQAYVTGFTDDPSEFPVVNAYQSANNGLSDGFVLRLDYSGAPARLSLAYSTLLGGSGDDFATGIAVDAVGDAYVTGYTNSTNFPTTAGVLSTANTGAYDAFVSKLSFAAGPPASLTLTFSTYLGGTDDDFAMGIALDSGNRPFVTGYTASADFPTQSPYQASNAQAPNTGTYDAFVSVLNANATALDYSTYLGGTLDDCGYAIAVAADSTAPNDICAYVTGCSVSTDFPTAVPAASPPGVTPYQSTYKGGGDIFVAKIDPIATPSSLVYSTYLGGGDYEEGDGIAVDSSGNAYIAGWTWSDDFPIPVPPPADGPPFQGLYGGNSDAIIAKMDPTGTALTYASYLGGSSYDYAKAIAYYENAGPPDTSGALIAGFTYSTDFPTRNAFQANNGGASDAFVAKIASGNPALPDLVFTALSGPTSSAVVGKTISIQNTIKNQGATTARTFRVGFFLSPDVVITPGKDYFLGSRTIASLKSGMTSGGASTVTIPTTVPPGTYYIGAVVDYGNNVQESDETNNIMTSSSRTLKVQAMRPDLIVSSISGPTTGIAGGSIVVTASVYNQGTGATRGFRVGMYLSTISNQVTTADIFLGSRVIPSLNANASSSRSATVDIPEGTPPGTYYIGAIADDQGTVAELNENNNSKVMTRIQVR